MGTSQAASAGAAPELIAERYRLEKQLGRGGMAAVFQVYDTVKQRVVALKRLLGHDALDGHVARLFEREYQTLSQLVHPRIIEVYDYHTDAQGPFYTMELLTGGDLRQRSPVPWRDACRLLCDVCSALALLHSRRFVHRDLTPLNIRCTTDGRAKLFDFGSMAQFGRSKHVVGTPPFVAPEALHGQVIDGQTDLFALGATAYYALTGRHAYPARALAELPDLWRTVPAPPSTHTPGLPPALDELVMALLSQQPNLRPPSAAEVMERLSAIGGFDIQEALLVGEAYLSTPTLVGRDDQLVSFGRQLKRAFDRRGTSILVSGPAGTGRSRLLDACALDAKLLGAIVLRADATDSGGQRWGAATTLLEQLVEQLPEWSASAIAPRAQALSTVMPELVGRVATIPAAGLEAAQPTRADVQTALRDIVLEATTQRVLVLVLDDLDRFDEPSAALVALLANQSRQHPLLLVSSIDSDAKDTGSKPLSMMTSLSDAMRLRNLEATQTQALVVSLFGDVPNVRWLADRIFAATRGSPRQVMQVAQHLVDRGHCRYAAGTWTLPESLPAEAIGSGLRETIDPDLSVSALELARVIALSELERVTIDDCVRLSEHADPKQTQADVLALAAAGIIMVDDESVAFSRPSWARLLLEGLAPELRPPLHARVARLLESRPADLFRWIQQLVAAGETERALTLLVADVRANRESRLHDPIALFDYLQSLPKKWPETFHALIHAARDLGRPLLDRLELQTALLGFSVLTARNERELMIEVAMQLRHDCGLDLIEAYRDQVPPEELLTKALGDAQKRYDATPEHDRGLPILSALNYLGQLITQAIGMAGRALDFELLKAMPSLTPIMVLSPALAVVQKNLEATIDIMSGRSDRALDSFIAVAKRVEEPDGAGLNGTHRVHMHHAVLFAIGMVEANLGRAKALERADAVAGNPLFAVSALRLRAIYALFLGDRAGAEQYRTQCELLQIQNSPPQLLDGSQAMQWAFGYAAVGDLLRVKQCMADVEALAREFDAWKPVLHGARGAYQSLRGDHAQAEQELERALSMMDVGSHAAWPFCASQYVWSLVKQERFADAMAKGRAFNEAMLAAGTVGNTVAILVPLALAECELGQSDIALSHLTTAFEILRSEGGRGVQLAAAYEVRGWIALRMGDAAALRENAARCYEQYSIGKQPSLIARYDKLMRAARKAGLIVGPKSAELDASQISAEDVQTTVSTVLSTAQGPQERADRALQLLGRFSRCSAGYLYVMQRQGPALVSQLGAAAPLADMDGLVAKFLLDAIEQRDITQTESGASKTGKTGSLGNPFSVWTVTEGTRFTPLLLSHAGPSGISITGVAVMAMPAKGNVRMPARLLQALSKALYDAGDAITQLTRELEEASLDD